jgi:hypothetical protein
MRASLRSRRIYRAASPDARMVSAFILDPSIYVQCSGCGSVMEWPGCIPEQDPAGALRVAARGRGEFRNPH